MEMIESIKHKNKTESGGFSTEKRKEVATDNSYPLTKKGRKALGKRMAVRSVPDLPRPSQAICSYLNTFVSNCQGVFLGEDAVLLLKSEANRGRSGEQAMPGSRAKGGPSGCNKPDKQVDTMDTLFLADYQPATRYVSGIFLDVGDISTVLADTETASQGAAPCDSGYLIKRGLCFTEVFLPFTFGFCTLYFGVATCKFHNNNYEIFQQARSSLGRRKDTIISSTSITKQNDIAATLIHKNHDNIIIIPIMPVLVLAYIITVILVSLLLDALLLDGSYYCTTPVAIIIRLYNSTNYSLI